MRVKLLVEEDQTGITSQQSDYTFAMSDFEQEVQEQQDTDEETENQEDDTENAEDEEETKEDSSKIEVLSPREVVTYLLGRNIKNGKLNIYVDVSSPLYTKRASGIIINSLTTMLSKNKNVQMTVKYFAGRLSVNKSDVGSGAPQFSIVCKDIKAEKPRNVIILSGKNAEKYNVVATKTAGEIIYISQSISQDDEIDAYNAVKKVSDSVSGTSFTGIVNCRA